MPFIGGSKASSEIHSRVRRRLEEEFGYKPEEAAAVKSLLWNIVKEAAAKTKKAIPGVERAQKMESLLTEEWLKENISKDAIKKHMEVLKKHFAENEKIKKNNNTVKSDERKTASKKKQKAGSKKKRSLSKKKKAVSSKRKVGSKKAASKKKKAGSRRRTDSKRRAPSKKH